MDDKKNEDYVVQMPDRDFDRDEKDSFLAKPNLARPSRGQNDLSQSFSALDNSPPLSVVAYCLSSISMTVVNKYVVSGTFWNLNFFYLAVQVLSSPRRSRQTIWKVGTGMNNADDHTHIYRQLFALPPFRRASPLVSSEISRPLTRTRQESVGDLTPSDARMYRAY
jgi:hypothetical protein